jgi:CHAT domain-containing protein/tetratricopeptide (TPR) repeat protein
MSTFPEPGTRRRTAQASRWRRPHHAGCGKPAPRVLVVALCWLAGCHRHAANDPLGQLADAGLVRNAAPRLSVPLRYRSCVDLNRTAEILPHTHCQAEPGDGDGPTSRLGGRPARRSAAESPLLSADSLHASAILELLWRDDRGIRLKRAISYLDAAVRLDTSSASALTDLSAAYLVRSEWSQAARDLLEALDAADQALAREPRNPAARFNRALAMDRLWLVEGASSAWTAFLEVDSTSEWAEEARRRQQADLAAAAPLPLRPASTAEAGWWAERAPQEAQLLGWDHVLGEWGEAVMRRDRVRAEDRLRLAAALGFGLERRRGDATLGDAVRAVEALRNDPAATRALARAHHDYAAARNAYRLNQREAAEAGFAAVLANPRASRPLRRWAGAFYAATRVYRQDYAGGERTLRALIAEVDTVRNPALAGRARWNLGTTLLRRGRFQGALAAYRAAAQLLARAGEREHAGAVLGYAGDAQYRMGDMVGAYASMYAALAELHHYRDSVWLHSLLWTLANAATTDGLVSSGLHIQDEGLVVAGRIRGNPEYLAEAYLARARLLTVAGERERAAADVAAAHEVVRRLPTGAPRAWLTADARLVDAGVTTDTARADAALDSAVHFFADNALRLLPALTQRVEVRLARNDLPGAEADLGRLVRLLDEQRDSIDQAPLRASLVESARGVFDRAVMLRLRAGRPDEALEFLERGRLSFAPLRGGAAGRHEADRIGVPSGEVAVDYALIGDTLLAWTVSGRSILLYRSQVDRRLLLRTIQRVRLSLELRAPENVVRPVLDTLYRWLVRPVEARLGRPGTRLVLVADGEIADVPFPALYDARRRRYLVQDHALRFVASLVDARHPVAAGASAGPVLLVGDPAVSRERRSELGQLPAAAAEVAALRTLYSGTTVLSGPAAYREALLSALRTARVLHYAGHALFDDERPDRSALVLAPSPVGAGPDELSAATIDSLHLGGLRLVVLSACETLRSRGGRTGGFAGLSAAFLHSGVRGVVGSLWRVDDELTRPLMLAFHSAYLGSGDGADALRTAQLESLRSSDPARRSPAAWAGFRFAGD